MRRERRKNGAVRTIAEGGRERSEVSSDDMTGGDMTDDYMAYGGD